MDSSLPANSNLIYTMKKEASESGVFEAFLESAPQFILQLSIVLWTGNISKYFFLYKIKAHRLVHFITFF